MFFPFLSFLFRYGIKLVMLCDADSAYMCNAIPYCGKKTGAPKGISLGEYFTMELAKPFKAKGRVVTTDNWFTSLPLARSLQKLEMHLVGTIRPKPYMPLELLSFNLEVGESAALYNYEDKATLLCQRVKSTKRVQILSTVHHRPSAVENKKTHLHMFYNATKGGVDTFDQTCASITCSRKTRRWPLCILYGIINIVVNNAYVHYRHNPENTKISRRQFASDLAMQLGRPWALQRLLNKRYLPRDIVSLIATVYEVHEAPATPTTPAATAKADKKQRCYLCPSNSNTRTKLLCGKCQKTSCGEHSTYMCEKCSIPQF
ncbi:piggyBac transposable element-derived protein 4-like isoform X1 [Macrobrachium rosenbergii]|uniref:piggyBac transposable element-derived protein 4-like isoform X1 n=1 Tax=Macrobrachium rosenbergii TaxID=79674 RepID=UPI0034D7AD45